MTNNPLSEKNFEIKQLKASNEKDLFLFMKDNLKNWEKFILFWNWRKKNPKISGGSNAVVAIKNNQQILGTVGVVAAKVKLYGKKINIAWQQDSLVSETMRGCGLGKSLIIKGMENWDVVIAKGTSDPMYKLREKIGFKDVPNSDYLVLVLRPRSILKNAKKSMVDCFIYIWQFFIIKPPKKSSIYTKSINFFNTTFDIIAEKKIKDNAVRLYKDSSYLNWRYFTCPSKKYMVFSAQGKFSTGAIVLSVTGVHYDEGYIVDMICGIEDKLIGFALLQKAIEYFVSQKIYRIKTFSTHPLYRKWFVRFGFLTTGISPRFTFWRNPSFGTSAFDKADWDFWHGDGDIELYM